MACRVGQLAVRNSALFICDIQEKFRHSIQYFPAIAQVTGRLLDGAKLLEMPVVVTEQYPKGLGHTASEIGLSKYPDLVPVEKTQFSMMTPQVVERMSKEFPQVKNVILCGIEGHVCVQGTALTLIEHGFDVHVVVDAVSSRTQVDRMFAFQRMKAAGSWLTTSESVLLGLVGDAKHPQFKAVQKIILESAPDSGLLSLLTFTA